MKVTTPGLVRFSYVNLVEPKIAPGATDAKYGMSVIVPKKEKATVKAIEDAIAAAEAEGKEKFGSKWKAAKKPLRDGDTEREDDAYANSFFFNANSKNRPGMVDKKVQPIIDPAEIKSGDWGCVSINFYAFSVNGNSGIAAGLNHVQKVKDGEPLGGMSRAEDDFEKFEDEEDAY